jgi:hypothetical protein
MTFKTRCGSSDFVRTKIAALPKATRQAMVAFLKNGQLFAAPSSDFFVYPGVRPSSFTHVIVQSCEVGEARIVNAETGSKDNFFALCDVDSMTGASAEDLYEALLGAYRLVEAELRKKTTEYLHLQIVRPERNGNMRDQLALLTLLAVTEVFSEVQREPMLRVYLFVEELEVETFDKQKLELVRLLTGK